MTKVKEKTLDLLVHTEFKELEARKESLESLRKKYKWKVIERKLYELSDKGYIEFGGHPIGGWLTSKGVALLEDIRNDRVKTY